VKKYLYFGIPLLVTLQNCTDGGSSGYYNQDDFATVEKYDSHVHINSLNTAFLDYAAANNFHLLSLNVAAPEYVSIEKQQEFAVTHLKKYKDRLAFTTSFHIENINDDDWEKKTIAYLQDSFDNGAVGVKVWKNVGMVYKDPNGQFVMVDDPRLDPIWDFIQKNNKTLVGHLGEPKNCWLPIEKMTVKNDQNYFEGHPEYHMYLHPEFPSYEQQIQARDQMLEKHAGLRFDGAHLGSLEWNLDELALRLDKFPNMMVDMAARISHIQYQAIHNHQKVYDFFIKYQDRLLYATDLVFDDSRDAQTTLKNAGEIWKGHWTFFTSDQMLEAPELDEKFKALHLPKTVIDKIYRKNAEKWFPQPN
jgi:predicted TIM-barrel fold metal-dependent hydrolase